MIETISQLYVVLIRIPSQRFVCQFFEALAVYTVTNYYSYHRAELTLQVDEASQTESKNDLSYHHILVFGVVLITVLFFEVTNVEVDEDMQDFSSQDYED